MVFAVAPDLNAHMSYVAVDDTVLVASVVADVQRDAYDVHRHMHCVRVVHRIDVSNDQ